MNKVSRFLVLPIMVLFYSVILVAQENKENVQQEVAIDSVQQDTQNNDSQRADQEQDASDQQDFKVPAQQQLPAPVQNQAPVVAAPQASAPAQDQAPAQKSVLAQEPEPVQEPQEKAEPEEAHLGPDEVMGIDTVDLEDPQGNWLYKRVWWERAEAKYEKIRAEVGKVMEMRTGFFARRAELDKNVLDPFYIKIGLSQGELQEILKGLIEKSEAGIKTEKNEEILEKAQDDKKELEKLQADVKNVQRQDEELENAVMTLVNQISKLRAVEQQAWQDFKGIARVLDDRKARELFYKVDNGWRNVQELSNYIQGSFSSSFDQLIERIKTLVTAVDSSVATLKEKGVELKNRANEPVQEEQEPEEEPKGIFTRYVIDPIKGFFGAIWSVIRWPYDAIMGLFGKAPESENDEDMQEEPARETEEAADTQPAPVAAVAVPAVSTSIPQPAQMAPASQTSERQEQQNYDIDEDDDAMTSSDQQDTDDDASSDFENDDSDFAPVDQLQESVNDEE